jgi:hypothetical protein
VRYAEMSFSLADGALVLAVARALGLRGRWPWVAAILFSAGNWVGQNYYSPQAFAFVMFLSAILIVLTTLRGRPYRLGGWFERITTKIVRARHSPVDVAVVAPARSVRVTAIVLVLLLQAVMTTSHQLTPYALVAAFVPLLILGYLRPWWLAIPVTLMPILFLIPNIDYIQSQFGLFTGLDPVSNIAAQATSYAIPSVATTLQARGVLVLTAIVAVTALVGLVRRARTGDARRALLMLWLAASPVVILFGQSYGGEGKYRVVLYATPMLAIAATWAFHGRLRRVVVTGVALAVLVGLLIATTLQSETSVRTSPSEVKAGQWLDGRFKADDTVISVGSFPTIVGGNYENYTKHWGQALSLEDQASWYKGGMTAADLKKSYADLDFGGTFWFVDSTSEENEAVQTGAVTRAEIASMVTWVKGHSTVRYDKHGVVIYEVDGGH